MFFSISILSMFNGALKIQVLALAVMMLFSVSSIADTEGDRLLGFWFTEDDTATVQVYLEGGEYFGRIIVLKEPLYPAGHESGLEGQPKVDRNNPESEKQAQSIVGLNMLRDLVYAGNNKWKKGKIYDPSSGKDYDCKITLKVDGTLSVKGYIGFSLFGRTTIWRRTTAPNDS